MTGREPPFERAVKPPPALLVGDSLLPDGDELILVLGGGRIEGREGGTEGNKGFEEIPKLLIVLFPLQHLLAQSRRRHRSAALDCVEVGDRKRGFQYFEFRSLVLQFWTARRMADVDEFGSVAWESAPMKAGASVGYDEAAPVSAVALAAEPPSLAWTPAVSAVTVNGATKELEGTKDMFVSYSVSLKVSLPRRSPPALAR